MIMVGPIVITTNILSFLLRISIGEEGFGKWTMTCCSAGSLECSQHTDLHKGEAALRKH